MGASMVREDYAAPRLRDFGGLTQLTSDFDASFHGSVVKIVSLAVASVPLPGGGGNTDPTGGGVTQTPSSGGTLGASNTSPTGGTGTSNISPGTSGGTGQVLDSGSRSLDPSGATDPASTLPDATRGANSATVGAVAAGGRLPFTGYSVFITAGFGAALAGAGAAMRSGLRRIRT